MADLSRHRDVAIVTHEDFFGNFIEQYLAVFFKELSLQLQIVSLLQDMQSDGYTTTHPDVLSLSRTPYTKTIVNSTAMLKSVHVDLMIVLGHGKKRGEEAPSAITFTADEAIVAPLNMLLYASRYLADGRSLDEFGTITTLVDVTARSKLAIVLSCHADQILKDFLSDGPTAFTDMLICDRADMDNQSFCIFFVLLVNLIDSDVPDRPLSWFQHTFNRRDVTIDEVVKRNIRRIFQIVREFGTTVESFWDFLQKSGCVSSLATVKNNQGLPNTRIESDLYYRVSGIPFNFPLEFRSEYKKRTILDDFKCLKLVCWDADMKKVVYETWESKFDTPLDVYRQLIRADTDVIPANADVASPSKRARTGGQGMPLAEDMPALLAHLQELVCRDSLPLVILLRQKFDGKQCMIDWSILL
jgi:hypothetical protein